LNKLINVVVLISIFVICLNEDLNLLQDGTLIRFSSRVIVFALLRRNFFSERVTDIWNSLPSDVVNFSSLASFKRSINSVDFSEYLVD